MPREPVTLHDCTEEEVAELRSAQRTFLHEKAEATIATPYGLQYSPHYKRRRP